MPLSPAVAVPLSPAVAVPLWTFFPGARADMNAPAATRSPQNTTLPRGNFTLTPRSMMSAAATSTTIHTASSAHEIRLASPSPHSSPCSPCSPWPHSLVGCQSGHSTGPDRGHTNPPCAFMSLSHDRMTRTVSGFATGSGAGPAATFRVLVAGFFFVVAVRSGFSRFFVTRVATAISCASRASVVPVMPGTTCRANVPPAD